MSFPNEYLHRTASKEATCFVCGKFSSAVLATADNADWFYVCVSHIGDDNFATCLNPPPPTPPAAASAAGTKKNKAPEKDAKNDAVEKTTDEIKEAGLEDKDQTAQSAPKPAAPSQPPPQQPPPPAGPRRYRLDKNIFYLRTAEFKKKKDTKNAADLMKRMPSVPNRRF